MNAFCYSISSCALVFSVSLASIALAEEKTEFILLPREATNNSFLYGVEPDAAIVKTTAVENTRIHYCAHIAEEFDSAKAIVAVNASLKHVSKSLGCFRRNVRIFVADEIKPKKRKCASGRIVAVCYFEGEVIIVVRKDRFNKFVLTHELVHAWYHEQKKEPPSWLEEGIAEYVETHVPNGYSKFHTQRLREQGLVEFAQFGKSVACTKLRKRERSSAWWFVYHLMETDKCSLEQVRLLATCERYEQTRAAFDTQKVAKK